MKHVLNSLKKSSILLVVAGLLAACASNIRNVAVDHAQPVDPNFGVLLMAHGGSDEWNGAVLQAASELSKTTPVEIAFGMADAGSLEDAVRRLEESGVDHVGVVRLFISGESWYRRTRQILGIESGAPSKAEWIAGANSRPAMRMPMGFWQIDSELKFHLSEGGLANAWEMDGVIRDRVQALSTEPDKEVVVVLAHGPGDNAENRRWIDTISARTVAARSELGLRDIRVFSLREDWEAKRVGAEAEIRAYVEEATKGGADVIVVPYRVQGFGPYADVLKGLRYRASGKGLLPHSNVGTWIANQAARLEAEATQHERVLLAARNTSAD